MAFQRHFQATLDKEGGATPFFSAKSCSARQICILWNNERKTSQTRYEQRGFVSWLGSVVVL